MEFLQIQQLFKNKINFNYDVKSLNEEQKNLLLSKVLSFVSYDIDYEQMLKQEKIKCILSLIKNNDEKTIEKIQMNGLSDLITNLGSDEETNINKLIKKYNNEFDILVDAVKEINYSNKYVILSIQYLLDTNKDYNTQDVKNMVKNIKVLSEMIENNKDFESSVEYRVNKLSEKITDYVEKMNINLEGSEDNHVFIKMHYDEELLNLFNDILDYAFNYKLNLTDLFEGIVPLSFGNKEFVHSYDILFALTKYIEDNKDINIKQYFYNETVNYLVNNDIKINGSDFRVYYSIYKCYKVNNLEKLLEENDLEYFEEDFQDIVEEEILAELNQEIEEDEEDKFRDLCFIDFGKIKRENLKDLKEQRINLNNKIIMMKENEMNTESQEKQLVKLDEKLSKIFLDLTSEDLLADNINELREFANNNKLNKQLADNIKDKLNNYTEIMNHTDDNYKNLYKEEEASKVAFSSGGEIDNLIKKYNNVLNVVDEEEKKNQVIERRNKMDKMLKETIQQTIFDLNKKYNTNINSKNIINKIFSLNISKLLY
jgi:hypothetical protein